MTKFEKIIKEIEKSNEAFNKMTSAEKRVEIARDCIQRIQIGNIIPNTGYLIKDGITSFGEFDNLKTSVNSGIINCEACAKGGLFISYIGRVNNFDVDDFHNDSSCRTSSSMKKLLEIFTRKQLDGIEVAFEQNKYSWILKGPTHTEFMKACKNYQSNCEIYNSEDAMLSICKNIIKNEGEFVPTDYVSPKARIK